MEDATYHHNSLNFILAVSEGLFFLPYIEPKPNTLRQNLEWFPKSFEIQGVKTETVW